MLLLPTDLNGASGIRCNFKLHSGVLFVDKIIGGFRGRIKGNLIRSGGRPPEEGRVWHTVSGRYADSSSKEPLYARNILVDM